MPLDSVLFKAGVELKSCFHNLVKSGRSTWFWLDNWVGTVPLGARFPKLFGLEKSKGCFVADRLFMQDGWICGQWDWSRSPTGFEEIGELRELLQLCQRMLLTEEDEVEFGLSGGFSVKIVKDRLVRNNLVAPEFKFEWNRLVPKMVTFVAWRAMMGRLPTFDALGKRNIPVASNECPFCSEVEEMVEHVLVSCGLTQSMWSVLAQWCKMPSIFILAFVTC
ncbi:uncharacterized protein LOC143532785 [Bidens hawaiensis]|uniref:uncharacterized protein LOC143532785 n=1 Tax=Bidens hawaiensis TaxID=980011 RepID=UPI00404A9808